MRSFSWHASPQSDADLKWIANLSRPISAAPPRSAPVFFGSAAKGLADNRQNRLATQAAWLLGLRRFFFGRLTSCPFPCLDRCAAQRVPFPAAGAFAHP